MRSHGEKKSPNSAPTPRSTTSLASLPCRCRFLGLPMDCPSGSCSPRDSEKIRRCSDWPVNSKRHSLGRREGLRYNEGSATQPWTSADSQFAPPTVSESEQIKGLPRRACNKAQAPKSPFVFPRPHLPDQPVSPPN